MTEDALAGAGEALLRAITVLTALLDHENDALARADRGALRRLAADKPCACRAYEEAAAALSDTAALLEPALRTRLHRGLTRLAEVSAVNRRRLAAALAAHHRLMELVAEALRARQPGAGVYAAGGATPRARSSLPPLALGFDREL